jgi:hypothetical protein
MVLNIAGQRHLRSRYLALPANVKLTVREEGRGFDLKDVLKGNGGTTIRAYPSSLALARPERIGMLSTGLMLLLRSAPLSHWPTSWLSSPVIEQRRAADVWIRSCEGYLPKPDRTTSALSELFIHLG